MTALMLQESSFRAVSPAALTGYVRSLNWVKDRPYRDLSDVYVGEGLPEIIVPRTQRIADYGFVVGRLIEDFSEVTDMDPQAVYHQLVNADRDVIRVSVLDADEDSLLVEQGVGLVTGSRDLLLASACSFEERRPVYRAGSNRAAVEYLSRVRLGHTEHGSFAVTLLPRWCLRRLESPVTGLKLARVCLFPERQWRDALPVILPTQWLLPDWHLRRLRLAPGKPLPGRYPLE